MINVYLSFNGRCREAAKFYASVFEVEEQPIMTYGQGNVEVEEQYNDLVLHTFLKVGESMLFMSDQHPNEPFHLGNNIRLAIGYTDRDEMTNVYHRLKEGGKVIAELNKTFFSPLYALVTDQFGITWNLILNAEAEEA